MLIIGSFFQKFLLYSLTNTNPFSNWKRRNKKPRSKKAKRTVKETDQKKNTTENPSQNSGKKTNKTNRKNKAYLDHFLVNADVRIGMKVSHIKVRTRPPLRLSNPNQGTTPCDAILDVT